MIQLAPHQCLGALALSGAILRLSQNVATKPSFAQAAVDLGISPWVGGRVERALPPGLNTERRLSSSVICVQDFVAEGSMAQDKQPFIDALGSLGVRLENWFHTAKLWQLFYNGRQQNARIAWLQTKRKMSNLREVTLGDFITSFLSPDDSRIQVFRGWLALRLHYEDDLIHDDEFYPLDQLLWFFITWTTRTYQNNEEEALRILWPSCPSYMFLAADPATERLSEYATAMRFFKYDAISEHYSNLIMKIRQDNSLGQTAADEFETFMSSKARRYGLQSPKRLHWSHMNRLYDQWVAEKRLRNSLKRTVIDLAKDIIRFFYGH